MASVPRVSVRVRAPLVCIIGLFSTFTWTVDSWPLTRREPRQKSMVIGAFADQAMHNTKLSGAALHNGSTFPIDFVYCWAGEDVQQYVAFGNESQMLPEEKKSAQHNAGYGFGEIRYSLKFLEANAPWFNKVYILVNTPANRPAWLTEASADKIVMIDRCKLFDKVGDCPTLNTHACQSVMHKIPGLSEHFVAMQDDFLVLHSTQPSDFFSSDGKPLVLAKDADVPVVMYDKHKKGPDRPPDKEPIRMQAFHHLPMPLLVSFARRMEQQYPEWFAFVQSHHTRFVCCDASIVGNGLDEDFARVYPYQLLINWIGVAHSVTTRTICSCEPEGPSPCYKDPQPEFRDCMVNNVKDPTKKFATIQNVNNLGTWHAVQEVLDNELLSMPDSAFVVEPKEEWFWSVAARLTNEIRYRLSFER